MSANSSWQRWRKHSGSCRHILIWINHSSNTSDLSPHISEACPRVQLKNWDRSPKRVVSTKTTPRSDAARCWSSRLQKRISPEISRTKVSSRCELLAISSAWLSPVRASQPRLVGDDLTREHRSWQSSARSSDVSDNTVDSYSSKQLTRENWREDCVGIWVEPTSSNLCANGASVDEQLTRSVFLLRWPWWIIIFLLSTAISGWIRPWQIWATKSNKSLALLSTPFAHLISHWTSLHVTTWIRRWSPTDLGRFARWNSSWHQTMSTLASISFSGMWYVDERGDWCIYQSHGIVGEELSTDQSSGKFDGREKTPSNDRFVL